MAVTPLRLARQLCSLIAGMVVLSVGDVHSAHGQVPGAAWSMLSGPLDPQPTWQPRAIHDPIRHRMVIVDGLNPGVLWTLSLAAAEPPRWHRSAVEGPTPPPRWNASASYDSLRDRVIVFGGRSSNRSFNDVWALSIGDPPSWTPLTPEGDPPSPRESHAAVFAPLLDALIVFGGYSQDSSRAFGDTWALRFSGPPTWNVLTPAGAAPGPRNSVSAVYDPWGDRMILFGRDPTVWTLSLTGPPTWDSLRVDGTRPLARFVASAVVDRTQRRMIVHGGTRIDTWGATLADTWALALDGAPRWDSLATTGVRPSVMQHAAIHSPERHGMIEFGGTPNTFANACNELDLDDLAWSRILPSTPDSFPIRRGGALVLTEPVTGRTLMLGGTTGCFNDLWEFDREASPSWTRLPTGGSPPDLCTLWSSFTLWHFVWDAKRDRILGIHGDAWWGRTMNRIFALPLDGSRDWKELVHEGVGPLGRYDASLMYDPIRDRVLMFGGVNFGGNRAADSGTARDDLWALSLDDTLRWTQLQPQGSPGTRDSHTAWYDARRDRMVVFGGQTQFGVSLGNTRQPRYDTWALSLADDSLTWVRLSETAPTSTGAVLDPVRDRLVCWPGDSALWVLPLEGDGDWRPLVSIGDLPTPRHTSSIAFDASRDRLIVYGGILAEPGTAWSEIMAGDLYEARFLDPVVGRVALEAVQSQWDQVDLIWNGPGAGGAMSVSRAGSDSVWTPLATLLADDSNRIRFTDRQVAPGRRYGYALSLPGEDRHFGETWVTIPPGPGFALRGLQPNPAATTPSVAFTLPDAATVHLRVVDVTGRRVVDRRLEGLGPGAHVVSLTDRALRPGLYFVSLRLGARTLTSRGVIVR